MTILHVLSQHEPTGAEVYAVHLAHEERRLGHTVLIVSDTLTYPYDGTVFYHPISKRSYPHRVRNIRTLVNLIRRHNVQVVNAHSRAASWVSNVACKITGTAFVSTVHGLQHLHASSRNLNIYGRSIIAVSERLAKHMREDLRIPASCVTHIPNGFHIGDPAVRKDGHRAPTVPLVMFAGRLSGPKGDVLRCLLKDVLPQIFPTRDVIFRAVCCTPIPPDIAALLSGLQERWGERRIIIDGFQKDLPALLRKADLVVGSGRIALESLLEAVPTVAFGETGFEGVVRQQTFDARSATNFGDTGTLQPTHVSDVVSAIVAQLETPLPEEERRSLQDAVRRKYDVAQVALAVAGIYRQALSRVRTPRAVPVLMYHRVVHEPPVGSRHGIWVTAANFRSQMRSLRRRGFSSITFAEMDAYLRGEGSLPARPVILTFDDGYEDNLSVASDILTEHGMKAVIFMVAGRIGSTNTWDADEPQVPLVREDQLRKLVAAGHEIGSHTMTHPDLSRTHEEGVRQELADSKSRIEEVIGRPVTALAYPYGGVDPSVRNVARQVGYSWGIATNSGPQLLGKDMMEVRRIQIFPWTGRFGFWKKTQPWYLRYKAAKSPDRPPEQTMPEAYDLIKQS